MNAEDIGKKIKYFREVIHPEKINSGEKMTQADLGVKAFGLKNKNIAQQKIKKIELGLRKNIKNIEFEKICSALGTTVTEIENIQLPIPTEQFLTVPYEVELMFPRLRYYLKALEVGIEDNDPEHIIEQIESFSRYIKKTAIENMDKKTIAK